MIVLIDCLVSLLQNILIGFNEPIAGKHLLSYNLSPGEIGYVFLIGTGGYLFISLFVMIFNKQLNAKLMMMGSIAISFVG